MRAVRFTGVGEPLETTDVEPPAAGPGELAVRVEACGVCRTDLHLLDGEVEIREPPRILGHQIVGRVDGGGPRVGIPWLGWTCGICDFCRSGRENLCPKARFTGCDIDGGFAEWTVADERFCFEVPDAEPAEQVAPLLCAGLIGYRALRFCGDATRVGFFGFGAAAHVIAQVAAFEGRRVFAFTRDGDEQAQRLALELGAEWAGGSGDRAPEELDAAIIFAPVGGLVPVALGATAPGGRVVCAGIHMSEIPAFAYELLWHERTLVSVANLTRRDGEEFLELAPRVPVRTHVSTYPLELAAEALDDLRRGRFAGAAVVVP